MKIGFLYSITKKRPFYCLIPHTFFTTLPVTQPNTTAPPLFYDDKKQKIGSSTPDFLYFSPLPMVAGDVAKYAF